MTRVSDRLRASNGVPTLMLFRRDRADRLEELDDVPRRLGRSSLVWVDLEDASDDVVRQVAERFGFDATSAASLRGEDEHPAFRAGDGFVHVVAQAPDGDGELVRVACVVGSNWVVTAHDAPVPVLGEFAQLTSGAGPVGELDGPAFLAALLEWVLNEYSAAFDDLEETLEEFDARAMRGHVEPEAAIDLLVEMRRGAARLRRSLVAQRGTLLALAQPELEPLTDLRSSQRLKGLLDRYEVTLQTARDTRESIVNSFDVLIARTSHRTNEVVKVLTLVSLIFLPGALLAGVMGMNFRIGFFEHAVGFWVVVAVIAAIAALPLVVARARRWV